MHFDRTQPNPVALPVTALSRTLTPGMWDTDDGRRALADYLADVNDGVSVRGEPSLFGRIKRLFQSEAKP